MSVPARWDVEKDWLFAVSFPWTPKSKEHGGQECASIPVALQLWKAALKLCHSLLLELLNLSRSSRWLPKDSASEQVPSLLPCFGKLPLMGLRLKQTSSPCAWSSFGLYVIVWNPDKTLQAHKRSHPSSCHKTTTASIASASPAAFHFNPAALLSLCSCSPWSHTALCLVAGDETMH